MQVRIRRVVAATPWQRCEQYQRARRFNGPLQTTQSVLMRDSNILPELIGFCRQTVQVAARSGVDSYGQPSFGSDVAYKARVVGKRRLVRNDQGDQVISSHTVYFAATPAVGAHDRITLSTGDVNSTETGALQPPILSVGKFPDDLGRQHVILFLA